MSIQVKITHNNPTVPLSIEAQEVGRTKDSDGKLCGPVHPGRAIRLAPGETGELLVYENRTYEQYILIREIPASI